MIVDILVAGLLALVSFRSGMEYQEYRSRKAQIKALEMRIEALKEDKPKEERNNTRIEMVKQGIICSLKEVLEQENPEEAVKQWLAELEGSKPEEGSSNA